MIEYWLALAMTFLFSVAFSAASGMGLLAFCKMLRGNNPVGAMFEIFTSLTAAAASVGMLALTLHLSNG